MYMEFLLTNLIKMKITVPLISLGTIDLRCDYA